MKMRGIREVDDEVGRVVVATVVRGRVRKSETLDGQGRSADMTERSDERGDHPGDVASVAMGDGVSVETGEMTARGSRAHDRRDSAGSRRRFVCRSTERVAARAKTASDF